MNLENMMKKLQTPQTEESRNRELLDILVAQQKVQDKLDKAGGRLEKRRPLPSAIQNVVDEYRRDGFTDSVYQQCRQING